MLKIFSLFMFKILLDVNNSLVCSNLLLSKMINYLFFSSLFCKCSPKRHCHNLCNCEYTSSKVIIITFFRNGLALNNRSIIFEILFSMCFICGLGFRLTRHQEILLIQSGRFHNYHSRKLMRHKINNHEIKTNEINANAYDNL